MATQVTTNSRLQLYFITGADLEGKDIVKTKSFNNVKTDATPEALLVVSNALSSVQQYPLMEIKRNDTSLISPE